MEERRTSVFENGLIWFGGDSIWNPLQDQILSLIQTVAIFGECVKMKMQEF